MTSPTYKDLSRRERQIMDIIYERGQATAHEVQENLPDPPSYSAVRALLRVLVEKECLRHEKDGPKYVYFPLLSRETAKKSALRQLLRTFFDGSAGDAAAALLDLSDEKMSDEELNRLSDIIDKARKEEQ